MARLLVTGAAGFVGSHTLRALRRAGYDTLVLDDLRTGHLEFIEGEWVRCDVGDPEALGRVFGEHERFDVVLHFAASASVPESVANPLLYYQNNVVASTALVEAALRHGVRGFVFSSSAAVYGSGIPGEAMVETLPRAAENPYGATKAIVEQILEDVGQAHGLRTTALRYFNAAGSDPSGHLGEVHEPESHLIPLALAAAHGRLERFSIYGTDYDTEDGTCIRDFVHVEDLASAHVLAVEALIGDGPSGVFNVGSGEGHSVREVVDMIERVTERAVPKRESGRRPGDPAILVADPSRFRDAFGWRAERSELKTIVEDAWNFASRRFAQGPH